MGEHETKSLQMKNQMSSLRYTQPERVIQCNLPWNTALRAYPNTTQKGYTIKLCPLGHIINCPVIMQIDCLLRLREAGLLINKPRLKALLMTELSALQMLISTVSSRSSSRTGYCVRCTYRSRQSLPTILSMPTTLLYQWLAQSKHLRRYPVTHVWIVAVFEYGGWKPWDSTCTWNRPLTTRV